MKKSSHFVQKINVQFFLNTVYINSAGGGQQQRTCDFILGNTPTSGVLNIPFKMPKPQMTKYEPGKFLSAKRTPW